MPPSRFPLLHLRPTLERLADTFLPNPLQKLPHQRYAEPLLVHCARQNALHRLLLLNSPRPAACRVPLRFPALQSNTGLLHKFPVPCPNGGHGTSSHLVSRASTPYKYLGRPARNKRDTSPVLRSLSPRPSPVPVRAKRLPPCRLPAETSSPCRLLPVRASPRSTSCRQESPAVELPGHHIAADLPALQRSFAAPMLLLLFDRFDTS